MGAAHRSTSHLRCPMADRPWAIGCQSGRLVALGHAGGGKPDAGAWKLDAMMTRKAIVVSVFACAVAAVSAQPTLPAGVVRGPSMGGITEYDYPNGLRVLL